MFLRNYGPKYPFILSSPLSFGEASACVAAVGVKSEALSDLEERERTSTVGQPADPEEIAMREIQNAYRPTAGHDNGRMLNFRFLVSAPLGASSCWGL